MRKIVLLCAYGMSTSLLVNKMKEAAAAANYEVSIEAFPVTEAKEKASDADIILLGPQVRFNQKKVEAECPNVLVQPIDMKSYGTMDGKGVIASVMQALGD